MTNKKYNVFALLVLSCTVYSSALSQFSVDVYGGLNFAKLSNPSNLIEGAAWSSKISFLGGSGIIYKFDDYVGLRTGLEYAQKGVKTSYIVQSVGSIKSDISNNYIEIPMLVMYTPIIEPLKISLSAGPAISYLIESTIRTKMGIDEEKTMNAMNNYKKYNAAINSGIFVETKISDQVSLLNSAIYSYGLIHINKAGSNEKTRDLRFTIGLLYNL